MFIKITIDTSFYIQKLFYEYPYKFIDRINPSITGAFKVQDLPLLLEHDRKIFHTMVAKLLCIGKQARSDIMTIISYLHMRVQYANQDD